MSSGSRSVTYSLRMPPGFKTSSRPTSSPILGVRILVVPDRSQQAMLLELNEREHRRIGLEAR